MTATVRVRQPAVAGLFYPGKPAQLVAAVRELVDVPGAVPRPALAAVAPHAGYVYSGRTAGQVFARLEVPPRCVVLAPNHTGQGDAEQGGSVYAVGSFVTPAGEVPVDESTAAALLARCDLMEDDPAAHAREHAVEVQLPFLLARQPRVSVVPVVLGWSDWPRTRRLAEALAEVVRGSAEPVLLLASSDMNHYESAAVAGEKDGLALAAAARLDGEQLLDVTRRHHVTMCGRVPAAAVLHAARLLGATSAEVVHRSHSGQVTGDDSSVVSYAGMIAR
ncbi:MAG TPA: AmmeMemoRadiSam system protein B [Gemmatimonadales bacterium]|nr:AmmeMemoRadiSam system protein B [Gemmatimonadales bacterium]